MLIIPALRSAVVHNSRPYHFEPENVEGISAVQKADLNICVQKELLEEYEEDRLDAELRFHDLLKKQLITCQRLKQHTGKKRDIMSSYNYDLLRKRMKY